MRDGAVGHDSCHMRERKGGRGLVRDGGNELGGWPEGDKTNSRA